jgi:ABC-type polysaccharide/polyol phosphate export permease
MAIYPLRNTLAASFHFSIALLMVLALSGVLRGYTSVWPLLTLLPTAAILLLFGWSLATLFGLANVRFRDTHHLTEIALQILFYLTPVMYFPKLLADKHVGFIVHLNPVVPFLTLLRDPLVYSRVPSVTTYLAALAVTLCVATAAAFALKVEERRLIFHL